MKKKYKGKKDGNRFGVEFASEVTFVRLALRRVRIQVMPTLENKPVTTA